MSALGGNGSRSSGAGDALGDGSGVDTEADGAGNDVEAEAEPIAFEVAGGGTVEASEARGAGERDGDGALDACDAVDEAMVGDGAAWAELGADDEAAADLRAKSKRSERMASRAENRGGSRNRPARIAAILSCPKWRGLSRGEHTMYVRSKKG